MVQAINVTPAAGAATVSPNVACPKTLTRPAGLQIPREIATRLAPRCHFARRSPVSLHVQDRVL